MPISVRYTTVNGRVLCENRGGAKTLFMPDTLGNVIETRDIATGVKTSETTYWPFGEVRTQTGTNPSPWGFCGVWGYLQDTAARMYVRARYLRADLGRWMTVDPLWPDEPAYGYARNAPSTEVDLTGFAPGRDYADRPWLPPGESYVLNCCRAMNSLWPNDPWWFYNMVRNKGPWDFKQVDKSFKRAGNYHYGFVAACAGMSLETALRFGGAAQLRAGTSRPHYGQPWGGPPYGDDPADQYFISEGYANAMKWMHELKRKCNRRMRRCYEDFQSARDQEIDRMFREGAEQTAPSLWWER